MACLSFCVVLLSVLPTPEEQAYAAIEKIEVGPFDWKDIPARDAWAILNEELRAQGCTKYSIILEERVTTLDPEDAASFKKLFGEDLKAPGDVTISLKLDKAVPAFECIRYVVELSGCFYMAKPEGVLVYDIRHIPSYEPPSWRQELRDWMRVKASGIQRWIGNAWE